MSNNTENVLNSYHENYPEKKVLRSKFVKIRLKPSQSALYWRAGLIARQLKTPQTVNQQRLEILVVNLYLHHSKSMPCFSLANGSDQ